MDQDHGRYARPDRRTVHRSRISPPTRPGLTGRPGSSLLASVRGMRDLWRTLLEECIEPGARLVIGEGQRGHQAFGQGAAFRVSAGDAWQRLQHREIAQGRVGSDLFPELKRLGDALTVLDDIL